MLKTFVDNPKVIDAIYGDEELKLESVELTDLHFVNNVEIDAVLSIRLGNFPKNPPKKWVALGKNAAIMTLRLTCLTKLRIENLSSLKFSGLKVEKKNELIELKSMDGTLEFACKWIFVQGITGFIDSPDAE